MTKIKISLTLSKLYKISYKLLDKSIFSRFMTFLLFYFYKIKLWFYFSSFGFYEKRGARLKSTYSKLREIKSAAKSKTRKGEEKDNPNFGIPFYTADLMMNWETH